MKRFPSILLPLLTALLALLTAGCIANAQGLESIPVSEARQRMQSDQPPVLIDVREPYEFAAGHAPGALNVPLGDVSRWAESQPKDQPILVICQTGRRSLDATQELTDQGFASVTNVTGGTSAWQIMGFPIER